MINIELKGRLLSEEKMTYGETLGPAMSIQTQDEADEYLALLIRRHVQLFGQVQEEAERVVKTNLGYYAGYYNEGTNVRVQKLFRCSHPIFGNVGNFPTAEEAFETGCRLGAKLSKGEIDGS